MDPAGCVSFYNAVSIPLHQNFGVRSFLVVLCIHHEMILHMQPKNATSPAPRPLFQKRLQKGGSSMTFSILSRRGCWRHILSFSKSMTSGFLTVCLGPGIPEWLTSSAWQRGRCFPNSPWVPHQKHSSKRAVACPHPVTYSSPAQPLQQESLGLCVSSAWLLKGIK